MNCDSFNYDYNNLASDAPRRIDYVGELAERLRDGQDFDAPNSAEVYREGNIYIVKKNGKVLERYAIAAHAASHYLAISWQLPRP